LAFGEGAALGENYTVKQGDYLSKIASEHGFFDHTTIWNHPANAELKKKRQLERSPGGQDSLLRLLQEVAFFVQRMDGIPIPLQKVGKCAVSGFSAAGPFVNQAMTLQNAHFDQHVLREIYAFDLRQVDPQTFANSLTAWRGRNAAKDQEPRKFRIYTTDDSWFDPNANVDRTAATFTGLAGSRERAGINSSVVLLPLQFWAALNPNVPGDGLPADKTSYQIFSPDFKSVHQKMPALFMQHALKNSQFK
jgi:hypothetical protein